MNQSAIAFTPTEEEVKQYWEENKDIYQTERGYEISMVVVSPDSVSVDTDTLKKYYDDFKNQFLDENGQLLPFDSAKDKVLEHYKNSQAEKESLKEYISLRKGENAKAQTLTIYEGDSNFGVEFINALSLGKEQETLKPIATNSEYNSFVEKVCFW